LDFWKSFGEKLVNIRIKCINKGVEIHSFILIFVDSGVLSYGERREGRKGKDTVK
jgi:hypothetical protein